MPHHIFVVTGKSGSGKDTICQRLLRLPELALHPVVPYTTRPKRSGELEGREYHFVSPEQFEEWQQKKKVIEYRKYDTVYGPWIYFTPDDGQLRPDVRNSLMIGTLASCGAIRSYFGADKVCVIYLEVERSERLRRAMAREMQQEKPGLEELHRRFEADEQDFSEEKLAEAGISRRFENRSLEECTAEVAAFLRKMEEVPAAVAAAE